MIIWKGFGILIAIAGFAGFLAAEALTRAITGDATYYQSHPLPRVGGAIAAAALAFGMAKLLERRNPPRVVIDVQTGREITLHREDSFFFVPAKYLPYAILAVGMIAAFVKK